MDDTSSAPGRTARADGASTWADRRARLRGWLGDPVSDRLSFAWRRVSSRQAGRWTLVTLAVLLPSAAWGVATASAQANFGPHVAQYEVTLDHEITADFGPLGTLVIDSPLPAMLGVRVVVQEIPREITAVEGATTLEALGADLERYLQFFSAPQATVEVVVRALVLDAVRRTLLAAATIVALVVVVRALLGVRRRAELVTAIRPHRGVLAGSTAVTLLVVGTLTGSVPLTGLRGDARTASAVFDDTPLEGARITGRLAGVIDTYGGYAVDAYRDNQRFYDDATEAVTVAWHRQAALEEEIARLYEGYPARRVTPADGGQDLITMLVVSDLHCNVGMVPVIREVAELSATRIVLNAGDTTVNGTAVESYCVTAFAGAIPDGAVQVVADGNHDSPETAAHERSTGARVLDGQVIEVEGVRILGDADPRATRIGAGTYQRGDETLEDVARRMADVACADDAGVDLLLVHDPVMGTKALEEGCLSAQVSGHMHRRIGPMWLGHGTRYVSSSTAGARLGQPTIGPLNGTAELTVLRFDPESRRFVDYRVVRVNSDASASVGAALRWPGEPPAPRQVGGVR